LQDGDEILLGDIRIRFGTEAPPGRRPEGEEAGRTPTPEVADGSIILNAEHVSQGRSTMTASASGWPPEASAALAGLVNVADQLLQCTSVEHLFERILRLVFGHVPVENVFLLLAEDGSGQLVQKLARRREGGRPSGSISTEITTRAFRRRESILTLDAQADPRFCGQSIMVQGIRSVMCVPLWAAESTIGVIFADSKTRRVRLDEHHLHFLTLLAHVAAAAIEQARLRRRVEEETTFRDRLMRYHSPTLVDEIMSSRAGTGFLDPAEREVTVLFADIVGFSTRTEGMQPREVARLLNSFFSEMVDIIFEHEGTLDKFIGDAIMAIFGAPNDLADHAARAVQCAAAMNAHLARRNVGATEKEQIRIRIGINSGVAVAGDIGSERRVDYTVVGNTVNVASRLEAFVAKPGDIVIGESTHGSLRGRFPTQFLGEQTLKGILRPVKAYQVLL
jgi:adenylate cyclase